MRAVSISVALTLPGTVLSSLHTDSLNPSRTPGTRPTTLVSQVRKLQPRRSGTLIRATQGEVAELESESSVLINHFTVASLKNARQLFNKATFTERDSVWGKDYYGLPCMSL